MAAIQFLSSLDLNQNQTIEDVIENLSSAPSNPSMGRIYYNTSDKKVYYYNGSWVPLTKSPSIPSTLSTQSTSLTCTLPDNL